MIGITDGMLDNGKELIKANHIRNVMRFDVVKTQQQYQQYSLDAKKKLEEQQKTKHIQQHLSKPKALKKIKYSCGTL